MKEKSGACHPAFLHTRKILFRHLHDPPPTPLHHPDDTEKPFPHSRRHCSAARKSTFSHTEEPFPQRQRAFPADRKNAYQSAEQRKQLIYNIINKVSENRVFAATTAYAREKRLNLELTVNIHANTASVSV